MCKTSKLRPGAWFAIAVAIAIALAASYKAFGQDRLTTDRLGDPSGQTVVFVPGLATGGDVFEAAAVQLGDIDAHLITLAGFGGVAPPDSIDPFVVPAAEAVTGYIESANLNNVVLVGHSLGGQVALIAAGAASDRVSRVVVVDSAPFFAGLMQPGADPQMVTARRDMMIEQMAEMPREAFLAMMRQGLPAQVIDSEAQEQVFGWVSNSDQQAVAVAAAEIMAGDLRHHLDAVSAPVTLIYPTSTMISNDEVARRYAAQYERLERFEMRPVADSRHFIMLDQPERFAEELTRIIGAMQ
jgi:pimeloyl-ACP methyl ester carboxylesterase